MYLFLFLLFPVVSFFYAFFDYKSYGIQYLKDRFLVALAGCLFGALISAVFEFCVFIPVYQELNFVIFSILQFCFFILIPFLFFIIFILWAKDESRFKIENFLYFMLPFYSVYLPFKLFTGNARSSLFMLFIFPVLFLLMLFAVNRELSDFFNYLTTRSPKCVLSVFFILAEVLIPVLILSLCYFDFFFVYWLCTSVIFAILCLWRSKINLSACFKN